MIKLDINKAIHLIEMGHVVTDYDVSPEDFVELEKRYSKVYLPAMEPDGTSLFFDAVANKQTSELLRSR